MLTSQSLQRKAQSTSAGLNLMGAVVNLPHHIESRHQRRDYWPHLHVDS